MFAARRVIRIALIGIAACAACLPASAAAANPGDDAPGFASVQRHLATGSGNESATDAVVQPDGKVVVALLDDSEVDRRIVRLLPDGTLDASFGDGGTWHVPSANSTLVRAIALAPDGKIVWAGEDATRPAIVVGRLTSSGVPDTTFSGDGVHVSIATVDSDPMVEDVLVEPDGRVTVAGVLEVPPYSDQVFLGRLLPDGSDDLQFTGEPFTTFGSAVEGEVDGFGGMARLADGAYVVAVERFLGTPTVWRISAHGSTRISANVAVPNDLDQPRDVVAADATHAVVLLAGTPDRSGLAYLDVSMTPTVLPSGTADGVVRPLPDTFTPHRIVRQADGRYVVSGVDSSGGTLQRAVARVTRSGALDATFGDGGIRRLAGATSKSFYLNTHAVALADDGAIVSAWHVVGDPFRVTAVDRIVGLLARVRVEVIGPTDGVVEQVATWTVRVTNAGPDAAGRGTVGFRVGDGLRVTSVTGSGCAADAAGGRCRVDDLAPGASRDVLVRVKASAAGTRYLSAAVQTTIFDDQVEDDAAVVGASFAAAPANAAANSTTSGTGALRLSIQRIRGLRGRVLTGCGSARVPCPFTRTRIARDYVRVRTRPAPGATGRRVVVVLMQHRVGRRWVTRLRPRVVVGSVGSGDLQLPRRWRARAGEWRLRAQVVPSGDGRIATSSWLRFTVR